MTKWNQKQNFTPLVRIGEVLVRLAKLSLFERVKGLQPELDRMEAGIDVKDVFRGDPTRALRKQLGVAETRTNSFLAIVETPRSKF